jgi:hypothetical protein
MEPCVFAAFAAKEINSFVAVKQHGQIILLKGLQGFFALAAEKLHRGQASLARIFHEWPTATAIHETSGLSDLGGVTLNQPLCEKFSFQSSLQSICEEPDGHPVTFW